MKKLLVTFISLTLILIHTASASAVDTEKLVQKALLSVAVIEIFDSNKQYQGHGSGFVVTNNGDILTNSHVASAGMYLIAYMNDGKKYPARLKSFHEGQDIALLNIGTNKYTPLPIAKTPPNTGAYALAIGAPRGYADTITEGLVSAQRTFGDHPFLQVSCPIDHGSSGGPVFNKNGEVIGMSTFLMPDNNTLAFCVPAKQIRAFVNSSKGLPPQEPSYRVRNAAPKKAPSAQQGPQFVFMLKHNEARDGYLETYIDITTIQRDGNNVTFNLLSVLGRKYSKMLSAHGETAAFQVLRVEINLINRTSRILGTGILSSNQRLLTENDRPTNWEPIRRDTSINEYLNYILLSGY